MTDIKEAVREKYSQAAVRAGSCCGPASCSPISSNLYSDRETGEQVGIARGQSGERLREHTRAINRPSKLALDGRHAAAKLRRKRGHADIDAVPEDDGHACALGQDAGELAAANIEIVGPLQRRRKPRRLADALRSAEEIGVVQRAAPQRGPQRREGAVLRDELGERHAARGP